MASPRRQPRITLDQLHTFLAVAEHEHLTEAASALGHSQGSVSVQVKRLERLLGVPLFQRVGRNIRLTDVGRALRQLSIRALDVADQIELLASGYLAFERGRIALGAGPVIGAHRLSQWLGPFVTAHPDLDVQIRLAPMKELLAALTGGEADIIFVSTDVHLPKVDTLVLERTELVIVAASQHPLAALVADRPVPPSLAEHRHLAHEEGAATQISARRVLGTRADDSPTVVLEEGALMAALLAGLGYAVMPRAVVENDIVSGRLSIIPRRGARVAQVFVAASRTGLRTPAAQAFWEHLQSVTVPS